jgi:hypothetical protein
VRQVEVLPWIGEGCPDGVWRHSTYKTTAYALASRLGDVADVRIPGAGPLTDGAKMGPNLTDRVL